MFAFHIDLLRLWRRELGNLLSVCSVFSRAHSDDAFSDEINLTARKEQSLGSALISVLNRTRLVNYWSTIAYA
jgi:hypothetical protein